MYNCYISLLQHGEAFSTSTVVVGSKDVLIEGTQHPAGEAGLDAIQVRIFTYMAFGFTYCFSTHKVILKILEYIT